MNSRTFRVETRVFDSGGDPAGAVQIFETIEGTPYEFLTCSFVIYLQCLSTLVISLKRVLMKAADEGLIDDDVQGGQP